MFWGLLISLFFVFKSVVLADDVSISWISVPGSASLSTQFDVQVKVTASKAGTYYLSADNKGDGGCTMQLKKESCGNNNECWSNGCYVGVAEMQPITINSDGGSGNEILRLREISSSGSKTLYSYVYDANKTLLSTSTAGSITINEVTPAPILTTTLTPTPTVAVTSTLTPTPTKILTPTPTSAPVIEPTAVLEPTVAAVSEGTTQSPVDSSKKSKSFADFLPIILVILGLTMFVGPVFGPKILEKIKSKRKGPPQEPPQLLEHFKTQQPTSIREISSDGDDIRLE
ncbi:MAG: hypothetical protein PHN66_03255 [Candidatus Shapirobacteria bacterium]|nr:hypothetical protein [Candidatus Shapirobacteria bacterium]